MVRKLKKQVKPFVQTAIGLGIGSVVVGKIGGSTAAASQAGLQTFSGFLPVAGTALGAGAALRSLSFLEPDKRRKKSRGF